MDQGLKQRITGALVLVAAAVIFLPMLLSGQDETVTVEIDVPEPPVLDDRPIAAVVPLELPPAEPVAELESSLPAVDIPPPAPVERVPPMPEPPAAQVPVADPPEVAASAAPGAAQLSGDWVIQLASLSDAAKAAELVATLKSQGYNAYSRSVTINGNRLLRIYAGPVADRAMAARLRDELERLHRLKGLVVAFDDNSRPQP